MSVASGEGSHWDTAVAILMLRQCVEDENKQLSRNQKNMWVWAREGQWNDRTQLK